ncbi:pre-rRNA processing and 40S ribosomal subunit assembly [Kalmusia sp. IMI 367209]|nr:pre-rRNA processing and 40S ribosomal subunit assembly [Kalmusia sp. IMI 367209]
MAPTLGKRKRITREELEQSSRASSPSSTSQSSDAEDMQALFRKAFEAKFAPLEVEPVQPKKQKLPEPEDIPEEESDWSGISSDEDENAHRVQIIDYASTQHNHEKVSKADLRAFMSAKPPSRSTSTTSKPAPLPKPEKDDPLETAHLKNDLELQKLLRESTLLSAHQPTYSTRTGATRASASTSTRHKLTDLHIQSLGAKSSIFSQKSMPMAHRKGIVAKQKRGDAKRRAEAKENGIVLEREKRETKAVGRRERGVGAPSVGKFKGGTLTLSKRDLAGLTSKSEDRGRGGEERAAVMKQGGSEDIGGAEIGSL